MKKCSRPTIAFIGDNLSNEYEGPIWSGAAQTAKELDINLLGFANGFNLKWPSNRIYNLVKTDQIDGMIALSGSIGNTVTDEEFIRAYKAFSTIPIVSVSRPLKGMYNLVTDNKSGMRELLRHMIEVHHYKRIAFISGPENSSEAVIRLNTYRSVLEEYQLEYRPELVYQGDFWSGGVEAVREFLDERKVAFEALVASNDYMAIYAMKELQRRGIRVPDDIAVTGFDDLRDARIVRPALTTVGQPMGKLGEVAVQNILAVLGGDKPIISALPTHLVVRQSCGCGLCQTQTDNAHLHFSWTDRGNNLNDQEIAGELDRIFIGINEKMQDGQWTFRLFQALRNQLLEERGEFLNLIEQGVKKGFQNGIEVNQWFSVVRSLFDLFSTFYQSKFDDRRLNDLGYNTFELIGRLSATLLAEEQRVFDEKYSAIQHLYHELTPSMNAEEIKDRIAENFSYLNINSFYLARFVDKERKLAKLFYYHNQSQHTAIQEDKGVFPANHLIPGYFREDKGRFAFIVLPIMEIGFALYEIDELEATHANLLVHTNTAMKLTSLMSIVCQYASELEKDVTERTKQLEEVLGELKHSNEELQDKNAILADLVERDSLTGLYNHSAIHKRLEEIVEDQRRFKMPVSVMMIDVDDFKRFNDEHGHTIGDEILLKLSGILKNELQPEYHSIVDDERMKCVFRRYDIAGRYGGDEFVVILPYCGELDVVKIIERFNRQIHEITLPALPGLHITVSMGIAVAGEEVECGDGKALLKLADQALYQSKLSGKDCFTILKFE